MPSARIRVNSHLQPYKTSPSPAIRDITVSGHTRHLHLRPYDSSPAETCICNSGSPSQIPTAVIQPLARETYARKPLENPGQNELWGKNISQAPSSLFPSVSNNRRCSKVRVERKKIFTTNHQLHKQPGSKLTS